MQEPFRLSFRNMAAPIGVEEQVRARIAELEQYSGRIVGCNVTVEPSNRRHHRGNLYHVRIELFVPGGEIVVRRDPPEHHAHEDLPVALRDAFNAAQRQLQDRMRELRGDVKAHAPPAIGKIASLLPDHGFLVTESGEEVYFHKNAVLGAGYDGLNIGDKVRYVVHEGEGEQGPQASTVVPV